MLLGHFIQLASFLAKTSPVLSIVGILDLLLYLAIEGRGDFVRPRLSWVLYERIYIIDRFENGRLVLSKHIILHLHRLPRVRGTDVIRRFSLTCHTIPKQGIFIDLLLLEQRFPLPTHGAYGLAITVLDFPLLVPGAACLWGATHCYIESK